jgi:PleD family two-component response regulator
VAEWTAGEPTETLLKRADDALYAAKDAGRNRTVAIPAPA